MKKGLSFLLVFTVLLVFAGDASAELLQDPLNGATFAGVVASIADYIAGLVAGLAVLMFIWAGILFATAGAKPSNIELGKKVLLYAVIGVAIALAGTGLIQLIKTIIGV